MTTQRLGVIMNGVTGRMGLNQHLIRSIIAIRDSGGVLLGNGDRMMPDPILVGRDADKLERLAKQFCVQRWTTDLDKALTEKTDSIFFDAATTQARPRLLTKAINAGKHVYCEKPIATNLDEAVAVLRLANAKGVKHGTVQDKLFLPGLKKLAFLRDSGFFGRMLSVRGEFGYWVFEGDWQEAQRPSWNYRSEDGGGIILDMVCHWRYVLDNLFGEVESVSCLGTTDIPERWDEKGKKYKATADDSAYATFRLKGGVIAHINMSWVTRVYRDDLVTFQVDGTHGSAVAGLTDCVIQARQVTPRPLWNPDEKRTHDFYADWQTLPENTTYDNGFKEQWKCSFATYAGRTLQHTRWMPRVCSSAECALQLARMALDRRRADQGVRRRHHEQAGFACLIAVVEIARGSLRRNLSPGWHATFPAKLEGTLNRVAFSAVHVVPIRSPMLTCGSPP
jgi:predicted dehydrogenase